MDKEEYYKIKKQRVLEMSIETLRQRYFDLDEIAQGYFKKMNEAVKELDKTRTALSITQSQLSEKDKEINALKEQVTPIPVSERLPEPGEKVLVYGEFGPQMCYRGYFYGKIEWLYHINSSKVPYEITHWLPIPKIVNTTNTSKENS